MTTTYTILSLCITIDYKFNKCQREVMTQSLSPLATPNNQRDRRIVGQQTFEIDWRVCDTISKTKLQDGSAGPNGRP